MNNQCHPTHTPTLAISKSPIQQFSASIHSMIHPLALSSATADAPRYPRKTLPETAAAPPPLPLNPPDTVSSSRIKRQRAPPVDFALQPSSHLCPDPWLRPANLPCHANLIQKHFLQQPVNVRVDFLYLLCSPEKSTTRPLCQEPSSVQCFPTNGKYASKPINVALIFIRLLFKHSLFPRPNGDKVACERASVCTHMRGVTHLLSAADILVILMRGRRLKRRVVLGVTVHVQPYDEDQRSRRGTRGEEIESIS